MIAALGSTLSRWSRRLVPDPLVLALALTAVALLAGYGYLAASDIETENGVFWTVTIGWTKGMTGVKTLAFALKMGLILITGYAIACSPPVAAGLDWVAGKPGSAASATVLVALVSCLAAVVHWGLGMIAGALLARNLAKRARARGLRLHYPLLGAAAYSGFAVWHGGLTGSAPTLMASRAHLGQSTGVVPMSETVFSPMNLIITASLIALIALVARALLPRDPADFVEYDEERHPPLAASPAAPASPGDGTSGHLVDWLQESRIPGAVGGGLALSVIVAGLTAGHLAMDLDTVVLGFLFLSLALHGSISAYVGVVASGSRGVGAILVQFPLYGGILGILQASGLIAELSHGLAQMANAHSFPVIAFLSAGVLNLFIPSGGGQWIAQGDILLHAGTDLGVDPSTTILAFSYGDAWSNMLQPFWALPILAIMGLRARDIIGYTAVIFLALGIALPALLLLLP